MKNSKEKRSHFVVQNQDMFSFIHSIYVFAIVVLIAGACNSPMQSQKYFAKAVKDDPILEPIHQTALYTVFFDHALQRCILHSSYTWGESGGGTGGTGLGVAIFNCNPQALKAHVENLRKQIDEGKEYFELPVPRTRSSSTPQRHVSPAPTDNTRNGIKNSNGNDTGLSPTLSTPASSTKRDEPSVQSKQTQSNTESPDNSKSNAPNDRQSPPIGSPSLPSSAPNATGNIETTKQPLPPLQPVYQP